MAVTGRSGGALLASGTVEVDSCVFQWNRAPTGPAVTNVLSIDLENSEFRNNSLWCTDGLYLDWKNVSNLKSQRSRGVYVVSRRFFRCVGGGDVFCRRFFWHARGAPSPLLPRRSEQVTMNRIRLAWIVLGHIQYRSRGPWCTWARNTVASASAVLLGAALFCTMPLAPRKRVPDFHDDVSYYHANPNRCLRTKRRAPIVTSAATAPHWVPTRLSCASRSWLTPPALP